MTAMGKHDFLRRDDVKYSAASVCITCFQTLYAPTKSQLIEMEDAHSCDQRDHRVEEPLPLEWFPHSA